MKQLTKNNNTGKISLEEIPIPSLGKNEVLVQNIRSAVSLGTEKAQLEIAKKNLLEKAKSRPDDLKKVIKLMENEGIIAAYKKSMAKLNLPAQIGYSSVGMVIKTSDEVKNFKKGDIVACGGIGHSEIIAVKKNLCCKVPSNVSLDEAAFTTIAAIAMQGVRQSNNSVGETVVVIGLGLIGLITLKILEASGCNAFGVDIDDDAVKKGRNLGLTCFNRKDSSINQKLLDLSSGYGIDSVIITAATKSNDPIDFSSEILRDKGKITIVGDVKTELPRKPFYLKELTLNFSKSYGPGRYDSQYEEKGEDYPIGFVRWTENRNMHSVLDLLNSKKMTLSDLGYLQVDFSNSPKYYKKLRNGELDNPLVLVYSKNPVPNKTITIKKDTSKLSNISVGIIGAGNYAQNFFIPLIKDFENINLEGLVSNDGSIAKHIALKNGFAFASTDPEKIFSNPKINTVFILTRHDSHAEYVIKSLSSNKNTFVEKPLALNIDELSNIKNSYSESNARLVVGYNRRYSPHVQKIAKYLSNRVSPICINIMVNSGKLNSSHWVHDLEVGGGRIIGEMCHFVDLSQFITKSKIVDISSFDIGTNNSNILYSDSITSNIKFSDGSVANISYYSNGPVSFPKERIEVFSQGEVFSIDDFKTLTIHSSKKVVKASNRQDKGHKDLLKHFFNSLRDDTDLMNFDELFEVSKLMFKL